MMEKFRNLFFYAGTGNKSDHEEERVERLKKDANIDEHRLSWEEFYERVKITEYEKQNGLTTDEAQKRLLENGPNQLTPPYQVPKIIVFLKTLVAGFNALLWLGAAASLISYGVESAISDHPDKSNLYLGVVLIIIVTVTSVFQFYQENKSSSIMEGFSNMAPPKAVVFRDGEKVEIEAKELVIGDLLEVSSGDRVPADMRIVECVALKVDNSSMTGENDALSRSKECTDKQPLETKNLMFFGSSVVEGSGKGIIFKVGDDTYMGRIAQLTADVTLRKTPIAHEMDNFIRMIGVVAGTIGVIFFGVCMFLGYDFIRALLFFIGIVVANVPEGIVATVTVCLTLTAQKMNKKHCLVKNLQGVETLGSTSVICSDKTGTLTQNKMTVAHVWWYGTEITPIRLDKPKATPEVDSADGLLLRSAALCSRAEFKPKTSNKTDKSETDSSKKTESRRVPIAQRDAKGDASEVALLRYSASRTSDRLTAYRSKWPKVAEIPFNSTIKYQLSIHRNTETNSFVIVMKGAPEVIREKCSRILDVDGEEVDMDADFESAIEESNTTIAQMGERALGFADFELDPKKFGPNYEFCIEPLNFPTKGFRFLGLISMIDPPRPGVLQAVRLCQAAMIRVVMVTGDHPVTAEAIARQVNIFRDDCEIVRLVKDTDEFHSVANPSKFVLLLIIEYFSNNAAIVIHGVQLSKLRSDQLDRIVDIYTQLVFSRTSPAQKLQIVEAYQRCGRIVAVTGDGVNDAPALRKADIGIAMGITGTEVSKQAADMILMNDNFTSIVTGVEEGRLIFDNLKKAIAYILTSNVPEVTPFVFYVVLGIPLPLSIICILLIDAGTDLWPAISYAYEPPETDIMTRPPRDPQREKLVNWKLLSFTYLQVGVMQSLAGFTAYFLFMAENGFLPRDLLYIREAWEDTNVRDVEDSFGQQWDYESRRSLETCAQGVFFWAIVTVQWADLFMAKTRTNSLLTHGFSNTVLNTGLLSTVVLSMFFLYTPYVQRLFGLTGLRIRWCMVSIPFGWFMLIFDETRRMLIRRYPNGFIYRETYF